MCARAVMCSVQTRSPRASSNNHRGGTRVPLQIQQHCICIIMCTLGPRVVKLENNNNIIIAETFVSAPTINTTHARARAKLERSREFPL